MHKADTADTPSLRYAWFVVALLMLAYVFSFVDRQIVGMLVKPMRADLGISDTQVSLLGGISFALFYCICGIPLGRLADRGNRVRLVAAGVFAWSFATALCGLSRQYWQLFMARIGVGVGEAALSPAAYSLISDYFPPDRRATAISVYSMGIYVGSGIAFLLGGLAIKLAYEYGPLDLPLVGLLRPWQTVFLVLGVTGAAFSVLFLVIREPQRKGAVGAPVPLREALAWFRLNRRTVLCHNIGFAMLSMASYASAFWIPAFFERIHGWGIARLALVYGSIVLVFGPAGIVFGGWLADRWGRAGVTDATMRVGLMAAVACVPFGALFPLMPTPELASIALAPAVFALAMPFGVAASGVQDIMPNRLRGQASAVYLFIVNLIGLGCGPTAVALVTDYVFHDDAAVRWSLMIVGGIAQAAAIALLWSGLAPYRASIVRLRALAA
ncbi:MAG TPA: MFS transporter [Solimonas sp.]|nr:MFS transporter [Solimonas sp.]